MGKKPVREATDAPPTMTLDVPALGGLVTVRALTWRDIHALRPVPFDLIAYTVAVIAAGTVSPKLDLARCLAVYRQHSMAPLHRVFGAILAVSGMVKAMRAVVPPDVARQWFR